MLNKNTVITSRQNPTVKSICSLADKKGRRAERLFRFDGAKLFGEAVACRLDIKYAVLRDDTENGIEAKVEEALRCGALDIGAVLRVSPEVFDKISEERSPEGIITVAGFMPQIHREIKSAEGYSLARSERILIAESLRDPGNLGTVIRSCAALGIDRLIISEDCADIYSPKVIRAAMGGLFRLRIDSVAEGELSNVIRTLREGGRRIYATALHEKAEEIGSLKLREGDCFVIGNEGHGLSAEVINACDGCAVIPMTEGSESLNAAAAAAICIWETVRS